jgi:TolB-like protein
MSGNRLADWKLSLGWETQIDDPLLREDINEAACGDPSSRMSSAAALAERLRTLDIRRRERAKLEEVERHQRQADHRRDRMRASRPWMFTAGISLLIAIMIAGFAWHRTQSTSAGGRAIAILQFENNGSDHTLDFLSFALPDEIETQLSYARSLPLRPFSLTSRYNPHGLDLHKVGNDLQISKIVAGSYFRTGADLAITLEAFDVESNRLLWRRNLSVPAGDLRTMQGQIAGLARTELASALGATGNSNDSAAHPLSEGAYERYLRSLALAYDPAAVNKQGLELLEESVKEDPSYAPAWLELGRREYIEFRYGQGGVPAQKRWNFAVNRVLELDPGNLAASASLIVYQVESGQYSEALAHARELVRLRPDTSAAHFSLSYVLRYAGLMEESGKECDAAFAIDPYGLRSCAVAFLALGEYAREISFIPTRAASGRMPCPFTS